MDHPYHWLFHLLLISSLIGCLRFVEKYCFMIWVSSLLITLRSLNYLSVLREANRNGTDRENVGKSKEFFSQLNQMNLEKVIFWSCDNSVQPGNVSDSYHERFFARWVYSGLKSACIVFINRIYCFLDNFFYPSVLRLTVNGSGLTDWKGITLAN